MPPPSQTTTALNSAITGERSADWLSLDALHTAWNKVRGNDGCSGGDGETIAHFARSKDARLAQLHWRIGTNAYVPGPFRRVEIPKKNGETRVLHIPCVTDRIVQTAFATGLNTLAEPTFSDDSFGYRKGRSVRQAVDRVAALRRMGHDWVVDADIRGFFDNVPHADLLGKVAHFLPAPSMKEMLSDWLGGFAKTLGTPGRGLAQGSPLSPLLANIWLDDLDDMFAAHGTKGAPVRIVRFADDFVLLARSRKSAEAAMAEAAAWLAPHGLILNPEKSRIAPFEQAFDFLGHLFIRSVLIAQQAEEEAAAFRAVTPAPPPRVRPISLLGPAAISTVDYIADDAEEAAAHAVLRGPETEGERLDADDILPIAEASEGELSSGLIPLYVWEKGRQLDARGDCFVVRDGVTGGMTPRGDILRVPATKIGRIEVGPDVAVMPGALHLASAQEVPVALLNGLGATQSVLMPPAASQADLHMAQMQAFGLSGDGDAALPHARMFVERRLRGQHALLKRLNQRRKLEQVDAACDYIKTMRDKASRAVSIDTARGFEGAGGARYWPALGMLLLHGFALNQRRMGADNPVVAVLNFTAHLLARDMAAAVLRAGLHPGFGALHSGGDGRDACAWDLVEAFRAPLSEGLAVYLFNNRMLKPHHFHAQDDGSTRLTAEGSRVLVRGYEDWLGRAITNPRTGQKIRWRALMLAEARAFAACLRRGEVFAPYALDY